VSGLQTLVRKTGLLGQNTTLARLEQLTPTFGQGSPLPAGEIFGQNRRGRVVLFTGCIMNALYHRTHRATIEVLVANGFEVVIPQQTCCGALAHHSGETDIAAELAIQNIDTILATQPNWIVVNAAGCGSTLKEYHHLLTQHPEAIAFSEKVIDIMALLAQLSLEGERAPVPYNVTYHAACHLHHAQKVQQEPYQVLTQIPNLKLIPLTEADMCCGSAGVYNLAHPGLSWDILQEKMHHLARTDADVVLTGNPGCMLQLESGIRQAGLTMKVMHPIELLALSYRSAGNHLF
jgi:glycolate oxidase iron-sulfur subunit